MSWTIDEWFVIALARTIRPAETVFHGFGSPCAQVAMHVARRTHARDMTLIEGATYAINPEPAFIPPTGNDESLRRGAAYSMRFEEFFDAAIRGDVDRMFLSGGQIDPFGNTNVTAIGPAGRPKVKLGGGGGGCNLSATIPRLSLWTTHHRSGRTLVGACDFITDMGHRTPVGSRAELDFSGGGPQWLVTELGVFDYPGERARLVRIFPDVTAEQIRAATGFDFQPAGDLRPGMALDAGCGHGAEAIWLASTGWRVTAVDFSATALDHGRTTAEAVGADLVDEACRLLDDDRRREPGPSHASSPCGRRRRLRGRRAPGTAPGGGERLRARGACRARAGGRRSAGPLGGREIDRRKGGFCGGTSPAAPPGGRPARPGEGARAPRAAPAAAEVA